MITENYVYKKGSKLDTYKTDVDLGKKSELKKELSLITNQIAEWQDILYAEKRQALLIIFQGMDAAGKDSAIRAIFSGVNPQGIDVHGFKSPSKEEYAHDFLWRHYKKLPQKGLIGIFNRSHYENVLVTRVHPNYVLSENLPQINSIADLTEDFWQQRYEQINTFEKTQIQTGTKVIKFMLNISQREQHKRFLNRIENQEDNWKFSAGDWEESKLWKEYMEAYQKMLEATSTSSSPWHVIPCDDKPSARLIMGNLILGVLKQMNPVYPSISPEDLEKSKVVEKIIRKELD